MDDSLEGTTECVKMCVFCGHGMVCVCMGGVPLTAEYGEKCLQFAVMVWCGGVLQVWCPMTPEFYREYLTTKSQKKLVSELSLLKEGECIVLGSDGGECFITPIRFS